MDTTILTDPWIWVRDNVVPDDYCDHLIDKFEKEAAKRMIDRKRGGRVN